jgi:phosphopantothenoylcysteine decarboxylase/phosphopantothenate--cysteine ligase
MTHLLVTAGPTYEPLDPVRFLGNRSSGRVGVAIAQEAAARGVTVDLLLGPGRVEPDPQENVTITRFETAHDLGELLNTMAGGADLIIMAAAVSDFRPVHPPQERKIRRDGRITLELEPVPDLLAALAATAGANQQVIGFALEHPDDLPEAAAEKLARKGCSGIVANGYGAMEGDEIEAMLLMADGRSWTTPGSIPKGVFASWLLDHLLAGS